jgi:hypothetical protein
MHLSSSSTMKLRKGSKACGHLRRMRSFSGILLNMVMGVGALYLSKLAICFLAL